MFKKCDDTIQNINLSSENDKKSMKKSQITLKSNNKSDYNRNILLNYSKGIRMNKSIKHTNFNEIDHNNDLPSKPKDKANVSNKTNIPNPTRSLRNVSKIENFSNNQQLSSRSNKMKSSRSLKINGHDDNLEMQSLVKNMNDISNDRNISRFNTVTEKFDMMEFKSNQKNENNGKSQNKQKKRFSDGVKYNTFSNLNMMSIYSRFK